MLPEGIPRAKDATMRKLTSILSAAAILFLFLDGLFGARPSYAAGPPSNIQLLLAAARINDPLDFCGEPVPLNDPDVKERFEKEIILLLNNPAQVILWLKRTGRYMPYIEKTLRENRAPDDLKYTAVIESSLLPHIGSHAGAVGYWQFIRSTGVNYGLTIDRDFDDRRNLTDSTLAAIRYYKDLYAEFRSWTLAVAAYNMGEAGLRRRIEEQRIRDFYKLYLPQETQRHILKIAAVKLILENPEKFGYHLNPEDYYAPIPTDVVHVSCPDETPIRLIAEAAGVYFKKIKDLNPEIRGNNMPLGTYSIRVPSGGANGFSKRYARLLAQWEAKKPEPKSPRVSKEKKIIYVVQRGDSLGRIAGRFGVSVADLVRWNRLDRRNPIHPGQQLAIHR